MRYFICNLTPEYYFLHNLILAFVNNLPAKTDELGVIVPQEEFRGVEWTALRVGMDIP